MIGPAARLRPAAELALAMALGGLGGYAFYRLDLPLPWMLGAITACMLAALARLPISAPRWVRPPMAAIVGALLGSGFPPDVIGRLHEWLLPLAGLVGFVLASAFLSVRYFRVVGGFDEKTAYFAGMPGGLVEMTLLGAEAGADARRIALVHTTRILFVVFTVPFGARLVNHASTDPGLMPARFSVLDGSFDFLGWLALTAIAGTILGSLIRLPARHLMGPMLVSGALHVSGVTDFRIPFEIVAFAQVALGVTIGCRFVGVAAAEVGRVLLLSTGSTAILLTLTLAFATALHAATGLDTLLLVLAYAPGGLAEMGLVALSMGFDTAMVAFHHVTRVMMVGFGAGPILRLLQYLQRP